MLAEAFPRAPVIVVICDHDSIHHARKFTAYVEKHPRLELLYGTRYSPDDNPAERIWAALKNYVANTAVTWPGRLREIHSFFRSRSPDQMLATAAPWTSPWLPPGYEQNFWNAALAGPRRIESPGTDISGSDLHRLAVALRVFRSRGGRAAGHGQRRGSSEPEVRTMRAKDLLGQSGEQAAADYLASCGVRILDRNWRSADGEIDIVAVDRQVLVVCEVKSRTSVRYGSPLEAVSRAKRARLRRLAVQWLNAHGVRFDQVRVDVVGLVYDGTGGFTIEHIRGVG
jgi:uncharacterized protein (TIGR00252 family)